VPYQKTNTYTIDILTREGGNLQLIAEVVSQGRAVVAEPVDLSISPMDLFV
ncbi:MAG: hypothetical protein HYU02_08055, partial [Thaumarchaeota archaeon]|nr:hypothetical protein [Nitrososphaerota archaeon]